MAAAVRQSRSRRKAAARTRRIGLEMPLGEAGLDLRRSTILAPKIRRESGRTSAGNPERFARLARSATLGPRPRLRQLAARRTPLSGACGSLSAELPRRAARTERPTRTIEARATRRATDTWRLRSPPGRVRGGVLVTREELEASDERGAELERAELREKLARTSCPDKIYHGQSPQKGHAFLSIRAISQSTSMKKWLQMMH